MLAAHVVRPSPAPPPPGDAPRFGDRLHLWQGDSPQARGVGHSLRALAAMVRGRPVQYRDFWSAGLRTHVRQWLKQRHDVVIVDHFITLSNVPLIALLWAVLVKGTRLVFIAHNITPKSMLDAARLTTSPVARIVFSVQAVQAALVEAIVMMAATKTIFISQYDQTSYAALCGRRAETLFPLPLRDDAPRDGASVAPDAGGEAPYVMFIGSPSFAPNQSAIDWIDNDFAPALAMIDDRIRILLVGKATDHLSIRSRNVVPLGFLDDARMRALLAGCDAFISPVVFGSGIKIKVLEAIMAGCPVMATEQSLRGFAFMGIAPRLDPDDAAGSAAAVAALVGNAEAVAAARQDVRRRWDGFAAARTGKLAGAVLDAAGGGAGRGARTAPDRQPARRAGISS